MSLSSLVHILPNIMCAAIIAEPTMSIAEPRESKASIQFEPMKKKLGD